MSKNIIITKFVIQICLLMKNPNKNKTFSDFLLFEYKILISLPLMKMHQSINIDILIVEY
jgi:hypothetical protein